MGILAVIKENVVLVNRTNRVLSVKYDGESMALPPGRIENFPKVAIPFAISQNKLQGSEHPYDPTLYTCMIGIEGNPNWPCDPIPEEMLADADKCLQPIDRSGKIHGVEMEPTKVGRKAGFTSFEARASVGAGFDVNRSIE